MVRFLRELNKKEKVLFEILNTPKKIQNFLESLPINFEEGGETLYSPRNVLVKNKAHCFEGAIFAAAILMYHGYKPILLDLKTKFNDESHVVALFKKEGKWGAISKTNHASLRYRDPVYKSTREIVMSYFHEYFLNSNGEKTLRSYATANLKKIKKNWIVDENNLWYIDNMLENIKHTKILNEEESRYLRPADTIERIVGKITVWKKL